MYRALAVAVLLVVAGCNAPTGDSSTDAATVTPVAVPETTATPRHPGRLAPGVTDEGVVDPGRLVRTHEARLSATTYTVNQTLVRRDDNGTVRSRYVTRARFAAEPGRFRAVVRQADRENGTLVVRYDERFGDGDRAYAAEDTGNGTEYRLMRYPGGGPRDPEGVYFRNLTNRDAIGRLFTLADTEPVGTFTEDGTRFVRLRSPEPTAIPPLRNVTLTATVSERGVVRSYRVEYDVTRDGAVATTVAVSYTGVGTTTVERPAWVDRVNATATPA